MAQNSFVNNSINQIKSNPAMRRMIDQVPRGFKSRCRRVMDSATIRKPKEQAINELGAINTLLSQLIYEQTLAAPRTNEPKRLLKHGFKVYSQHDEDGIIEEIFRRIGSTNRFFVEFGVGDGLENCTLYCLLKNWRGIWIDGSAICVEAIENKFKFLTESGRLKVRYAFTTAENIEQHFEELGVPEEFDLLSIDIDNNDYWVWKAIQRYNPRVVAIEYNASFKQTVNCVIPYNPARIWNYTNYFGASLRALEELGREKGYFLVGCNYTGVTAFFVRNNLVGDHFAQPFSAENHYEAPRYYVRMPNGHPPGFGPTLAEVVEGQYLG